MSRERYPQLFQFFGAYFHQDWALDAPTADEVLDTFIRTHPHDVSVRIADMIDAVTAEVRDDQLLARVLADEFSCEYLPAAEGLSTRDWLRHVSTRLRDATLAN